MWAHLGFLKKFFKAIMSVSFCSPQMIVDLSWVPVSDLYVHLWEWDQMYYKKLKLIKSSICWCLPWKTFWLIWVLYRKGNEKEIKIQ